MQGSTSHLGDILATDWKIDLDALFDLSASLLGEPQQRMGDTLLDLLARHFDDAGLSILQPIADRLKGTSSKSRKSAN